MKKFLLILLSAAVLFAQNILPISLEIMRELRSSYDSGEIEEYIELVTRGLTLTEEQYDDMAYDVERFFDSELFLETGGAYLSALFTERELDDILRVMQEPSLRNDPNFTGARKLDLMLVKLKPYIVLYLRNKNK